MYFYELSSAGERTIGDQKQALMISQIEAFKMTGY
jgi:hypothetical protein